MSSPEALSLFDRHYQYYFPDPYRQWRQTRGYTYTLADGAKRGVEQGAWGLDARAAFKHTYTHMLERGVATHHVNSVLVVLYFLSCETSACALLDR